MTKKISDAAIGAMVLGLAIAAIAYALLRGDACMDKARDFARSAPAVTARVGAVLSLGTSSWLSGQAAARAGERNFYFLVKGSRAKANAIVSADRATCTCRIESVN